MYMHMYVYIYIYMTSEKSLNTKSNQNSVPPITLPFFFRFSSGMQAFWKPSKTWRVNGPMMKGKTALGPRWNYGVHIWEPNLGPRPPSSQLTFRGASVYLPFVFRLSWGTDLESLSCPIDVLSLSLSLSPSTGILLSTALSLSFYTKAWSSESGPNANQEHLNESPQLPDNALQGTLYLKWDVHALYAEKSKGKRTQWWFFDKRFYFRWPFRFSSGTCILSTTSVYSSVYLPFFFRDCNFWTHAFCSSVYSSVSLPLFFRDHVFSRMLRFGPLNCWSWFLVILFTFPWWGLFFGCHIYIYIYIRRPCLQGPLGWEAKGFKSEVNVISFIHCCHISRILPAFHEKMLFDGQQISQLVFDGLQVGKLVI